MATPVQDPIAIVAGGGTLPLELADSLNRRGLQTAMIAVRGFASRDTVARSAAVIDLIDPTGLTTNLAKLKARQVALVGTVNRPSPAAILGLVAALRGKSELRHILHALLAQGDDSLLRAVVDYLEQHGHLVMGLTELAPELLAGRGTLGGRMPTQDDLETMTFGAAALGAFSPYDIGQGLVVDRSRILAVEGPEGTDQMLHRVARLVRPGWTDRLRGRRPTRMRSGILIKMPKSGQDFRIDLPTIGPRTIACARAAHLRGIVVASGLSLIVDRRATVAAADDAGIFLLGLQTDRRG